MTWNPEFGVEPDYQQEHGGMKFADVAEGGPVNKAGFKSGDVLIQYGGRKIDNPIDYERLRHAYYEGEKGPITVTRGQEKITKEVTLKECGSRGTPQSRGAEWCDSLDKFPSR